MSSERIINGGFETGDFTGWTPTSAYITTVEKHSGAYSARFGWYGGVRQYLTEDVPVENIESLRVWVKGPVGAFATIRAWYTDATATERTAKFTDTAWLEFDMKPYLVAGKIVDSVEIANFSTTDWIYTDDVSLRAPRFLLTNEVIATELWKLLETNPAYSEDLTTKASPGKAAVCTYYKFRPGVDQATGGDFPSISNAKSGWRTESALNGSFPAGTWTFNIRLENDTKYDFSVKVAIRLSKSVNADGSSATLIGVYESPNVLALPAAAGASVSDSWTASLAILTMSNEYLFAEYRIHIEVAATNASAQCSFASDEDPTVANESISTSIFGLRVRYFKENLSAIRAKFSFLYSPIAVGAYRFIQNLSIITAKFSRTISYKRTLAQNIVVRGIAQKIVGFPRKFVEDLSMLREVFTRKVSFLRKLPQNLSAIRDVFTFVYTPIVVPVYRFVQNLSAIGDVFTRRLVFVKKFPQQIFIEDVFKRVQALIRRFTQQIILSIVLKRFTGFPRKFIENLSVLKTVFVRRLAYTRKAVNQTLISEVFKRVVGMPRKFVEDLSILRDVFIKKVNYLRRLPQNLSVIKDVFSFIYTAVAPPTYRFIQNLSAISDVPKRVAAYTRKQTEQVIVQDVLRRIAGILRKNVEVIYVQLRTVLERVKKWFAWLRKRMRLSLKKTKQHPQAKFKV